MGKEQHLFSFNLSSVGCVRKMNRQQYKEACRWLRIARNIVEERINIDKVYKAIDDASIYGTGVYVL